MIAPAKLQLADVDLLAHSPPTVHEPAPVVVTYDAGFAIVPIVTFPVTDKALAPDVRIPVPRLPTVSVPVIVTENPAVASVQVKPVPLTQIFNVLLPIVTAPAKVQVVVAQSTSNPPP